MDVLKHRKQILDYFLIVLGSMIMAFSIKNIYAFENMVTGGVSGMAIIIKDWFGIPLWISNTALNIPLFIVAIYKKGWNFVFRTLIATVALSVWLLVLPEMQLVQGDIILNALFGGVLSGVGIGLVFTRKATTGGTDMLASLIHMKVKSMSMVKILQIIDAAIVILGATVFGLETALYSLIAIYVSTKISDDMLEGLNYSKQAFIVSDKSEEIAKTILEKMDRGCTSIPAKGMYSGLDKQMLFVVVAKKEIITLRELVKSIDKKAFLTLTDTREVFGEGFIS